MTAKQEREKQKCVCVRPCPLSVSQGQQFRVHLRLWQVGEETLCNAGSNPVSGVFGSVAVCASAHLGILGPLEWSQFRIGHSCSFSSCPCARGQNTCVPKPCALCGFHPLSPWRPPSQPKQQTPSSPLAVPVLSILELLEVGAPEMIAALRPCRTWKVWALL